MVYLFGLLLLLFLLVSAIPFIQMLVSGHRMSEEVQYKFPQELFDHDMNNLRYERTDGTGVSRMSMQSRGSVRLAGGNILSTESFENRKEKAYSVELP